MSVMRKAKNFAMALAYLILLAITSAVALLYKSVLLGLFHVASFFDKQDDWGELIAAIHAP